MGQLDPDQACITSAAAAIAPELMSLGVQPSKTQTRSIATAAVLGWLQKRPPAWSRDRLVAHTGTPDAYTIGFAETILPALASGEHPFDKPVNEWSKEQMALFLAEAFELIEEQRVATLERDETIPF